MRNLLYIAALVIVGCSKPTMDDGNNIIERNSDTAISQTPTTTINGSNTDTTTDTSESTSIRIEAENGHVIRAEILDSKGHVAAYNYALHPNDGFRLASFSRPGTGFEYGEGQEIETTEELDTFIFSEFVTFEYNGRIFDVELSQIQRREVLEREWDLAVSYATGDLLDYDNRFVILEPRGYYFGARAHNDYTIYGATWAFEAGVILHEIAHVWSNESPFINWNDFAQLMGDNHVSDYGATALSEYIAEAVAHYLLPDHTVPQAIADLLASYGL